MVNYGWQGQQQIPLSPLAEKKFELPSPQSSSLVDPFSQRESLIVSEMKMLPQVEVNTQIHMRRQVKSPFLMGFLISMR